MSETGVGLYDLLLAVALLGAAWRALFGREPFSATVFFVAYGLLLALMWIQLGAPDVALAEAGIGAGLTGALLLGAIRQFEHDKLLSMTRRFDWRSLLVGVLAFSLSVVTMLVLWETRDVQKGILELVKANLDVSGSSHPITSVLLNFRGFDTWLELGVLLLAALSAHIVHAINRDKLPAPPVQPKNEQIKIIARTLLPVLILIGGIMLWFGARAPGGAFQAGALLGAAGILLQLANQAVFPHKAGRLFRLLLVIGFLTFTLVAGGLVLAGRALLEYPVEWAGALMLVIETAATLSIALTLNVMYASSAPHGELEVERK